MMSKSAFAMAAVLVPGSLSLATDASAAHGGGAHVEAADVGEEVVELAPAI